MDRWLKRPGESGYDDADARLLAEADWHERLSFYYASARDFPTRGGGMQRCEDLRAGCAQSGDGSGSGAGAAWLFLLLAGVFARRLRHNGALRAR